MSDFASGPLPRSDSNSELEELSKQALRRAFPVERFQVYDVTPDRGVDAYLEVKSLKFHTNFRAQIQLKATAFAAINGDSSISLPVDVANFRYLLNGTCPIYFLYYQPLDQLRFAWARDEANRLNKICKDWEEQKKISIRFVEIANAENLEQIAKRITFESQVHRKTHERLSNASRLDLCKVAVDLNGSVFSGEEACQIIEDRGVTLVAAGFSQKVLDLYGVVSRSAIKRPKLSLIIGYAHLVMGRFDLASGCFRESRLGRSEMCETDRWFLENVTNYTSYKLGKVTYAEYKVENDRLAEELGGPFGLYMRLCSLRFSRPKRKTKERGEWLEKITSIYERIISAEDAPVTLILSSHVVYMSVYGCELSHEMFVALAHAMARIEVAHSVSGFQRMDNYVKNWEGWNKAIGALCVAAEKSSNPLLTADIWRMRALVQFSVVTNALIGWTSGWFSDPACIKEAADKAAEGLAKAIDVYEKAGLLEHEMQARLDLASIYKEVGNFQLASEMIAQVLETAECMDYKNILIQAVDLRDSPSQLELYSQRIQEIDQMSSHDLMETMLKEDSNSLATEMAEALGLNSEMRDSIERDLFAVQQAKVINKEWCHYFTVFRDSTGDVEQPEITKTVTGYRVGCFKMGFYSESSLDWGTLFKEFQETKCRDCYHRCPSQVS